MLKRETKNCYMPRGKYVNTFFRQTIALVLNVIDKMTF